MCERPDLLSVLRSREARVARAYQMPTRAIRKKKDRAEDYWWWRGLFHANSSSVCREPPVAVQDKDRCLLLLVQHGSNMECSAKILSLTCFLIHLTLRMAPDAAVGPAGDLEV